MGKILINLKPVIITITPLSSTFSSWDDIRISKYSDGQITNTNVHEEDFKNVTEAAELYTHQNSRT